MIKQRLNDWLKLNFLGVIAALYACGIFAAIVEPKESAVEDLSNDARVMTNAIEVVESITNAIATAGKVKSVNERQADGQGNITLFASNITVSATESQSVRTALAGTVRTNKWGGIVSPNAAVDTAQGSDMIAIGKGASASGNSSTALGNGASATHAGTALGYGASATYAGTALGYGASATYAGTALGYGASATYDGMALGRDSVAKGNYSAALGSYAKTEHHGAMVIKAQNNNTTRSSNAPESFNVWTGSNTPADWYLGTTPLMWWFDQKQDRYDTALETVSTNIVGAINENRTSIVQEGQTRSLADEELREDLDTKVSKIAAQSGNPFVYGRNASDDPRPGMAGLEGKFTMDAGNASANTVVQRNGNGQICTAQPTANNHATPKKYVDDADAMASTKVSQTYTSVDTDCAVILKGNNRKEDFTGIEYYNTQIYAQPSSGTLSAKAFRENGVALAEKYGSIADVETAQATAEAAQTAAAHKAERSDLNAVSNQVQVIYTFLAGDGSHFSVTNYQRTTEIPPTMSLNAIVGGQTNMVWNQKEGMDWNYARAVAYADALVSKLKETIPDKAWSLYNSATGTPAPEGITWIGTKEVALSGGLEYAKVMGAEGGYYFLACDGSVQQIATSNGWMRITDDDGETIYTMRKSNSYTIGAAVDSFEVTRMAGYDHIKMHFNVVSGSQPTIMASPSLKPAEWVPIEDVATIVWRQTIPTGWQADIDMTSQVTGYFFKGQVTVEGKSMVEYAKTLSVGGGIYCTDGEHKCRPVYNSATGKVEWEVFQ